MTCVHRIRLRGPWRYEPRSQFRLGSDGTIVELTDSLPPGGTITPPLDLCQTPLGRAYRGRVRYRRRFGRPTRVDAHDLVHLVVPPFTSLAEVRLNGQLLGTIHPLSAAGRFNVTAMLKARNELWIDVVSPPAQPVPSPNRPRRDAQPVCLEIGPHADG